MFVIHNSQQGFVHIPRTAGRFIESQCMNVKGFSTIQPYHSPIPSELAHYQWHTRVRDPIERVMSLWRHNQDGHGMSRHKGTFDQFMSGVKAGFEWHTRPQADFITDNVRCWLGIEDCIRAMGGSITGQPINKSITPRIDLNQRQVDLIKHIYYKDVDLFQKLLDSQ